MLCIYLTHTKLACCARKSVFFGYVVGFKGSVLLDLHTNEIFISRNWQIFSPHISQSDNPITADSPIDPSSPIAWQPDSTVSPNISPTSDIPSHISNVPSAPSLPLPTRISSRVKYQPSHLKDYVCASFKDTPNQSSSGIPYPISDFVSYSNLSPSYCRYSLSLTTNTEPKSYNEASKYECWMQALKLELEALDKTGTWKLVDIPPNVKHIGCR
jgi:hypothetical protein